LIKHLLDIKTDRSQSETGVQCIAQVEKVWQDQVCEAGCSHGSLNDESDPD